MEGTLKAQMATMSRCKMHGSSMGWKLLLSHAMQGWVPSKMLQHSFWMQALAAHAFQAAAWPHGHAYSSVLQHAQTVVPQMRPAPFTTGHCASTPITCRPVWAGA
jgi:hypothetical protein